MKTENLIIAGKETQTSPVKWKNVQERASGGEAAVVFGTQQEKTCRPAGTVWLDGNKSFPELFRKAGMTAGQVTECARRCMETAGAYPMTNMEYIILSMMVKICMAGDGFFSRLPAVRTMAYGQFMDFSSVLCREKHGVIAAVGEEGERCYQSVQKTFSSLIPELGEEQTVCPGPGDILAYPSGYRYMFTGTLLAECLQHVHRGCPLGFTVPAHIRPWQIPAYTGMRGISTCTVLPGIDFLGIFYGMEDGVRIFRQCGRIVFCGEQMIREETAEALSRAYGIPDLQELADGIMQELVLPSRTLQAVQEFLREPGMESHGNPVSGNTAGTGMGAVLCR